MATRNVCSYVGQVRYIRKGEKGDKGNRGAVFRQHTSFVSGSYNYQSGADNEEFIDVIRSDSGVWYRCIKSYNSASTPAANNLSNTTYWSTSGMANMTFVATELLLAQNATINMMGTNEINLYDDNSDMFGSFRVPHGGANDVDGGQYSLWLGAKSAKDAPFSVTKTGGLHATDAVIEGRIVGSLRNKFTKYDAGISVVLGGFEGFDYYDNLAICESDTSGWKLMWELSWDITQSGRRINIVNYRYGDSYSAAKAYIDAPSGKYFYENGIKLSSLQIYSKERIELLGFGTNDVFHGWIVLDRQEIDSNQKYGINKKVLAAGKVVVNNTGIKTCIYRCFDGTNQVALEIKRTSVGKYVIKCPASWFGVTSLDSSIDNVFVNLTGIGYSVGTTDCPIKATVSNINLYYNGGYYIDIYIDTSDDESRNDGSFFFEISNLYNMPIYS